MAQANAKIKVGIDTGSSLAQLRTLQSQISSFNNAVLSSSKQAQAAQASFNSALSSSVVSSKNFTTSVVRTSTEIDRFSSNLAKGKLGMGEYFRYGASQVGIFRKVFTKEFDTINQVAAERVKRLQTQYISLGKDANGVAKSLAIMPRQLDMTAPNTQMALAGQRMQIFNKLVRDGSTQLLNFGKNTQWAGRQLMVGFTVPLAIFGGIAAKTFRDLEAEAINFRKVYGDIFTTDTETEQNLKAIQDLSLEFTKYGIAVKDSMALANIAAQAGQRGQELMDATTQATRLAVLGNMEQQEAMKTTISLQTAFGLSSEKLADAINFLNIVENQSVLSLQDVAGAIPRVAPVIQALGGDVRDMAALLVAMKEGGVSAAEGANALKSSLGRLITPTRAASEMAQGFGINLEAIVKENEGKVMPMLQDLAIAMQDLSGLEQQQLLSQIFGKFQYARIGALFKSLTNDASQANRVIELMGMSMEDLAETADGELSVIEDSISTKFTAALEKLKVSIAPLGQSFLEIVTPLAEMASQVLGWFNNLPEGVKKAITVITVAVAGIAPVALMAFGLVANGIANTIKFLDLLRLGFMKVKGALTGTAQDTGSLSIAQLDAAAASASLEGKVDSLTDSVFMQSSAVQGLIADLSRLAGQAQATAAAMPQGFAFMPGMRGAAKMARGGNVPGSGSGDTVPAMLTPGEFVINKKAAEKFGPLLEAINDGTIPGFAKGGPVGFSSGSRNVEIDVFSQTTQRAIESRIQQAASMGASAVERLFGVLQQFANSTAVKVKDIDAQIRQIPEISSIAPGKKYSGPEFIQKQSREMGWATQSAEIEALQRDVAQQWPQIAADSSKMGNLIKTQASHIEQINSATGQVEKDWTNLANLTPDLGAINNYLNRVQNMELSATDIERIMKETSLDFQTVNSEVDKLKSGMHPITTESAQVLMSMANLDSELSLAAVSAGQARTSLNTIAETGYQATAASSTLKERLSGDFYQTMGKRQYMPQGAEPATATAQEVGSSLAKAVEQGAVSSGADPIGAVLDANRASPHPKAAENARQDAAAYQEMWNAELMSGGEVQPSLFGPDPTKGEEGDFLPGLDETWANQQRAMNNHAESLDRNSGAIDQQTTEVVDTTSQVNRMGQEAQEAQIATETLTNETRETAQQISTQGDAAQQAASETRRSGGALKNLGGKLFGLSMAANLLAVGFSMAGAEMSEGMQKALIGLNSVGMLANFLPMLMNPAGLVVAALAAAAAGLWYLNKINNDIAAEGKRLAQNMSVSASTLQETADFFNNKLLVDRTGTEQISENLGIKAEDMEKINQFIESDLGKKMVEGFTTAAGRYGSSNAARDFASNLATMMLQGALEFDQAKIIAASIEKQTGEVNIAAKIMGSLESITGPDGKDVMKNPIELAATISLMNQRKFKRELEFVETAQKRFAMSMQSEDANWGLKQIEQFGPEFVGFVDGVIGKGREAEKAINDFGESVIQAGEQTNNGLQTMLGNVIKFGSSVVGAVTGAGESFQEFARGDNWATAAARGLLSKISPEFEDFLKANTAFSAMLGNDLRVGWDNVSAAAERYNQQLAAAEKIKDSEKREKKIKELKQEKDGLDRLTESMSKQQDQAKELMAEMLKFESTYADGVNAFKESIQELFEGTGLESSVAMLMSSLQGLEDTDVQANILVSLSTGQLNPAAVNRLLMLTEDKAADAAFIDLIITERGVVEANDFLTRLSSLSNKENVIQIRRVYTDQKKKSSADRAEEVQIKFRVNRAEQRRAQRELDKITKDLMKQYDVKDVNLLEKIIGKVDRKALGELKKAKDAVKDLKDEAADFGDIPVADSLLELAESVDTLLSKGFEMPEIDYQSLQLSNEEIKGLTGAWQELAELPPEIQKYVDTNAMLAAADAGAFNINWQEMESFKDIAKAIGVEDGFSRVMNMFGLTYDQFAALPDIVKAMVALNVPVTLEIEARLKYLGSIDVAAIRAAGDVGAARKIEEAIAREKAALQNVVNMMKGMANMSFSSGSGGRAPRSSGSSGPGSGSGSSGGDSGGGKKEKSALEVIRDTLKEDEKAAKNIEKLKGKLPVDVLARLIAEGADALGQAVKELSGKGKNYLEQIKKIINATGMRQIQERLVNTAYELRSSRQKFMLQNVFGLDPEVAQGLTMEETSYLADLLDQGGKAAKKAKAIIAQLNKFNRQAESIGLRQAATDFVKDTRRQLAFRAAAPALRKSGISREAVQSMSFDQFKQLRQLQKDVANAAKIEDPKKRKEATNSANKALNAFIKALNDGAAAVKKTMQDLTDAIDDQKKESSSLFKLLDAGVSTDTIRSLQALGFSATEIWQMFVDGGKKVTRFNNNALAAARAAKELELGLMSATERFDYRQNLEREILELDVQKFEDEQLTKFSEYSGGYDTPEQARRAIERIERNEIKPKQKLIDANQKIIDQEERLNELDERKIEDKEKIIDKINEQYDAQLEALDKIDEIEQSIFDKRQAQLNVANALSRGDIAAAAQAMLEAQRQNAEAQRADARSNMEAARDSKIKAIQNEIDEINERIEARKLKIRDLSDEIYDLEQDIKKIEEEKIAPIQEAIDRYEFQIGQRDVMLAKLDLQQAKERLLNGYYKARTDELKEQLRLVNEINNRLPQIPGGGGGGGGGGTDDGGSDETPSPNKPEPETRWDKFLAGYNLIKKAKRKADIEFLTSLFKGDPANGKQWFLSLPTDSRIMLRDAVQDGKLTADEKKVIRQRFAHRFAYGGLVPGVGSTDSVPSLLMPGEYVINKAAAARFMPLLQSINNAVYPNMGGTSGAMPKNGAEKAGDMYNYSIEVNAGSNADANDIANVVMTKIKMIEDRKVRGYNY